MNKIIKKIKDFIKNNSEILKPVGVLTAICLIVAIALSVTNLVTCDKIKEINLKQQNEAMKVLMTKADTFEKTELSDYPDADVYAAYSNDETLGYLAITSAKGYGGNVDVMTAVGFDGKIIGVSILSVADETPGLGQNAAKEPFYSQFKDKSGEIVLVKNNAKSEKNEINAVTGATITSKAVKTAVNEALDILNNSVFVDKNEKYDGADDESEAK